MTNTTSLIADEYYQIRGLKQTVGWLFTVIMKLWTKVLCQSYHGRAYNKAVNNMHLNTSKS